jgi:hypothetical protein
LLGFGETRSAGSIGGSTNDAEGVIGAATAEVNQSGRIKGPGGAAFDGFVGSAVENDAVLGRSVIADPSQEGE